MYFEPNSSIEVSPHDKVQIQSFLSGTRIDCKFDPFFHCFKAQFEIKIGEEFKFIVNGSKRVVSTRYPVKTNERG